MYIHKVGRKGLLLLTLGKERKGEETRSVTQG